MGRLTTHVLDTAHGCPAAEVTVSLYAEHGDIPLVVAMTNADGRLDAPLLEGAALKAGRYKLAFEIGHYFREKGVLMPSDTSFFEVVEVSFGIADDGAHYHVPLLVSPYGYTTYRGS